MRPDIHSLLLPGPSRSPLIRLACPQRFATPHFAQGGQLAFSINLDGTYAPLSMCGGVYGYFASVPDAHIYCACAT